MKRLTKNHILKMHSLLIQETGGIHGIRDEGLLDSALNAPFQNFDGEDLYRTI
jgi:death-on-curing protein